MELGYNPTEEQSICLQQDLFWKHVRESGAKLDKDSHVKKIK